MERNRERMRRGIAAAVVAATASALVMLPAPFAGAYTASDCTLGAKSDSDTDRRDSQQGVDWGDGFHWNGTPMSDGVICWYTGRWAVEIVAKTYLDAAVNARARTEYRVYNSSGNRLATYFTQTVSQSGGGVEEASAYWRWEGSNLDRVRVALQIDFRDGQGFREVEHFNRFVGDS